MRACSDVARSLSLRYTFAKRVSITRSTTAGRAEYSERDIMVRPTSRGMNPASVEPSQAMAQWKPQLPRPLSAIQRYGIAVVSVSVALGASLLLERLHFRDVEVPLYLFAVAVAAWYGGAGAAGLALLLSGTSFDYFFTEPRYSLDISPSDLPYYIVFASFASLV